MTKNALSVLSAQVAAFHEFGTVRVPERSFIRATLDNQRTQIEARVRDITRQLISNRRRLRPQAALSILGLDLQRRIQETIRRGIPPPLVSRDGTPLIDTGQLIQSITFKVT